MKTLFTALLAASALVPSVVHAQRFGADAGVGVREGRPDRPDRADRPPYRTQADVDARADARAGRIDPAREGVDRRDDRRDFRNERRDDRQDFARERQDDRRDLRDGNLTPRQFGDERRESRQDYRADRRDDRREFRADRRDDRQDYRADTRDLRRDAAQGRPGWQNYSAFRGQSAFDRRDSGRYGGRGAWNRGWRDNARYDWNRHRSVNRGAYRLPRYYAPSGWGYGYRRFSIGVTLSSGLWDQNYWIDDPYAYRLPEAYGPYRWVRYYDDALLIDIRSGRVVDTVYGIFY